MEGTHKLTLREPTGTTRSVAGEEIPTYREHTAWASKIDRGGLRGEVEGIQTSRFDTVFRFRKHPAIQSLSSAWRLLEVFTNREFLIQRVEEIVERGTSRAINSHFRVYASAPAPELEDVA